MGRNEVRVAGWGLTRKRGSRGRVVIMEGRKRREGGGPHHGRSPSYEQLRTEQHNRTRRNPTRAAMVCQYYYSSVYVELPGLYLLNIPVHSQTEPTALAHT